MALALFLSNLKLEDMDTPKIWVIIIGVGANVL